MHGLNWENEAYKLKRSIAGETLPTLGSWMPSTLRFRLWLLLCFLLVANFERSFNFPIVLHRPQISYRVKHRRASDVQRGNFASSREP